MSVQCVLQLGRGLEILLRRLGRELLQLLAREHQDEVLRRTGTRTRRRELDAVRETLQRPVVNSAQRVECAFCSISLAEAHDSEGDSGAYKYDCQRTDTLPLRASGEQIAGRSSSCRPYPRVVLGFWELISPFGGNSAGAVAREFRKKAMNRSMFVGFRGACARGHLLRPLRPRGERVHEPRLRLHLHTRILRGPARGPVSDVHSQSQIRSVL